MAKNGNFQSLLLEAHSLIQKGEPEAALARLKVLLKKLPKNADVAHLTALAHKSLGHVEDALGYFGKSLALNKHQPQVYNNLANLQKTNNDFESAEKNYRLAISMNSSYIEAHRNLAICYIAQGDFLKVVEASSKALEVKPDDIECLILLANAYRELHKFDLAFNHYQHALTLTPDNFSVWHNLGLNHHLQHQLEVARECYQHAYDLSPSTSAVVQSLALISSELGSSQRAASLFETYLDDHAGDVRMHQRFNEMLWETDLQERFGASYRRSINKLPGARELRYSYISQLFKAGKTSIANDELIKAIKVFGPTSELLALKGEILAEQCQYEGATAALSQSLKLEFSQNTAQQLVKLNIIERQYDSAQTHLNELMRRFPDCQLNWAYQSLVWRLTNDERYSWLMNYNEFIRSFTLETPHGYSSLNEFLRSLDGVLRDLHRMTNAPLQQTLRHGTQTAARLFHNPAPEFILLKTALSNIVERYINELPNDPEHPFLKRKSERFEFSGSWSVKLKPEGFHINHVHPDGWISSSCYVSIPNSMQLGSTSLEGQIKFGESPLFLGERESIEKIIKPELGLVVLFPSYCWHGTIAFSGSDADYRMTTPFDVAPL